MFKAFFFFAVQSLPPIVTTYWENFSRIQLLCSCMQAGMCLTRTVELCTDRFVDKQWQNWEVSFAFFECGHQQEETQCNDMILQWERFPRISVRCVSGAMKGMCENKH